MQIKRTFTRSYAVGPRPGAATEKAVVFFSPEEYIFGHLTRGGDGGELEDIKSQLRAQAEMIAKLAARGVESVGDLKELGVFLDWNEEVVL